MSRKGTQSFGGEKRIESLSNQDFHIFDYFRYSTLRNRSRPQNSQHINEPLNGEIQEVTVLQEQDNKNSNANGAFALSDTAHISPKS